MGFFNEKGPFNDGYPAEHPERSGRRLNRHHHDRTFDFLDLDSDLERRPHIYAHSVQIARPTGRKT
jgi:hypothetical protein